MMVSGIVPRRHEAISNLSGIVIASPHKKIKQEEMTLFEDIVLRIDDDVHAARFDIASLSR
jgi:hypothetical protein